MEGGGWRDQSCYNQEPGKKKTKGRGTRSEGRAKDNSGATEDVQILENAKRPVKPVACAEARELRGRVAGQRRRSRPASADSWPHAIGPSRMFLVQAGVAGGGWPVEGAGAWRVVGGATLGVKPMKNYQRHDYQKCVAGGGWRGNKHSPQRHEGHKGNTKENKGPGGCSRIRNPGKIAGDMARNCVAGGGDSCLRLHRRTCYKRRWRVKRRGGREQTNIRSQRGADRSPLRRVSEGPWQHGFS